MFVLCKPAKKRSVKLRHFKCPFLSEHDGKLKCDFGRHYPEVASPCPFGGHPLPWYRGWFQSASTKPQVPDYICIEALLGQCSHEKRTQVATGVVYCARGMHLKLDQVQNQTKLNKIAVKANLTMRKSLLTFQCPHPEPCTKDNDCQFGHQELSSHRLHPLASLLCSDFLSGKCSTKREYRLSTQDPTNGALLVFQRCFYGLHPTAAQLNNPERYLSAVGLILQATSPTDCVICLDPNWRQLHPFKVMNHQERCRHYFHSQCYTQWKRPGRHVACPTCRVHSFRSILWPRLFASETEKRLVFTLQAECVGLVDVLPESLVTLGPENGNSATPSQRILVVFDDAIGLCKVFPVPDGPAEPPQFEYEQPEPEPQQYHVYFHPENCAHYLTLHTYWTHHRSNMRRRGSFICPTCGTNSRFVLLWPTDLADIGRVELKKALLNIQKWFFEVSVPSHDPTVIIKQHQNGRFTVTINQVEETVQVVNGQLVE